MNKERKLWIERMLALAVVHAPFGIANAAIDSFEPYAYVRVLHDDNIFRLSDSQEAIAVLGEDEKDDTVGYLGAGFSTDLKLSRQHLLLDGEVEEARYDTYDRLDHTNTRGRATWQWQVGNLWSGSLAGSYKRRLSSFNEQQFPDKDMRTNKAAAFTAGYQIHPDWALTAGLSAADASYQDRKNLDRRADSGNVQITYRNTLNTRVGVRVRYTDNDLKNTTDIGSISISNDYSEAEISGVFYWEGSGKSSLEASLGYTDQSYDELDDRDYQGSTGRLTYLWGLTGKTQLNISIWRETSTLDDEITTYVLTRGISIVPIWSVTPLIDIEGIISYENDDFKGENDIRSALGAERRDDDTWRYGIKARWKPRQFVSLSLGYRGADRDSSIDGNDYDFNEVNGTVRFQF